MDFMSGLLTVWTNGVGWTPWARWGTWGKDRYRQLSRPRGGGVNLGDNFRDTASWQSFSAEIRAD